MDKQKAMDYILNSPQNTNPSVLSSVLDSLTISDNKEEIELSATENKVYTPDNGKVYKKVTVNVPAPPSDFSTAEVTIVNQTGGYLDGVHMPYVLVANQEQGNPDIIMPSFMGEGIPSAHIATYSAILYKGSCYFDYNLHLEQPVSITGSAEKLCDGAIIITGDCTITIGY